MHRVLFEHFILMSRKKLVDIKDLEEISLIFRGKMGNGFAEWLLRFLSIDKINDMYEFASSYSGSEFTSGLLDFIGVNYQVGNHERLNKLPDGAFITVSNHPYGGLDGIITIDLIAGIRPDYKFMVNKMLSKVKALDKNFICVTPAGNKKEGISGTSLKGIRETLGHLRNGHPVGFFPSGAVSDFRLSNLTIRDRKWQESILHLVRSVKVPILPIRFFDTNSAFFYFLGLLNWRIRLLRLPAEVSNKSGKEPRLAIGRLVTVKDQTRFRSPGELGSFLRKEVYGMAIPPEFISSKVLNLKNTEKI